VITPFILDTDIGTDVDDALALAFALRHPQLELRAVTTVSGDTVRRARIAAMLLRLAGRGDIEVAAGVRGEQSQPQRNPEAGHEEAMLLGEDGDLPISSRDAVTLLLDMTDDGTCEVATVGMQSNIAAAIDADPSFPERVPRLTVMGGIFAPVRFLGNALPPSVDHNLNVDQPSSLRALNAGMRTLYVPGDVTFSTWLMRDQVEQLRAGDALCRALHAQIAIWSAHMQSMARGLIPEEYACLLHDPLAVACMTDQGRRFVTTQTMPVTVAKNRGDIRTFVDPAAGVDAEVVTAVDAAGFARFWLETVLG
jgi:purine nucleosidase